MDLIRISRFISMLLRHKPQEVGLSLDEHGWTSVDELINGVNTRYPFTMEMLEEIVATDDKQRYSFNDDHTLIRANQGHSIHVDVELQQVIPPEYLWHGTAQKHVASIQESGLIPKSRLYVHLSDNRDTAASVGARHGTLVLYCVKAGQMSNEGYSFYLSANGVWLTKHVPTAYLERI